MARSSSLALLATTILTVGSGLSAGGGRGTTLSRRGWLAGFSSAIPALLAAPTVVRADPSLLSSIQGPVQDATAPGHWLGQFVGINSKTETWDFPDDKPAEVSAALVQVLNELTVERRQKLLIPEFKITRADSSSVHVMTWTKAEWLDSLDVQFRERQGGGCEATASFYATGFLPTSVPLAPLINIGLAWIPFGSSGPRNEMLQDFRLRVLQGLLRKKLNGAV